MKVALTFDMEAPGQAHWSPATLPFILRSLYRAEVKATFFVQGRWAQAEPGSAMDVVDEGHVVGTHSHFHAPWDQMTMKGFLDDVEKSREAVSAVTGLDPMPWTRAPFGAITDEQVRALGPRGYRHVKWNVDPGDWLPSTTPERIVDVVTDLVSSKEESVVLLHTWPKPTGMAMPLLIDRLKDMGATFETIPAMKALA